MTNTNIKQLVSELDLDNNMFYFDKNTNELTMVSSDPELEIEEDNLKSFGLVSISHISDDFENEIYDVLESMDFKDIIELATDLYQHLGLSDYIFSYEAEMENIEEIHKEEPEYSIAELIDDKKEDYLDDIMDYIEYSNLTILNKYLNKYGKYLYGFTDYETYYIGLSYKKLSNNTINSIDSLLNYGWYDAIPFDNKTGEFDYLQTVSTTEYQATEKGEYGKLIDEPEELEKIIAKLLGQENSEKVNAFVKQQKGLLISEPVNFDSFKQFYTKLDNAHKSAFDGLALVSDIQQANLLTYLTSTNRTQFNKFSLVKRLINTDLFTIEKVNYDYVLLAK